MSVARPFQTSTGGSGGTGGIEQPIPPAPFNGALIPGSPNLRTQIAAANRGFKIAENMSPVPQDRVFFTYNFYDDVNQRLNDVFQSPITHLQYDRYTIGFEKTFNDGQGSFGLRLPIEYVTAQTRNPNLFQGGGSTAVGNLDLFAKYILCQDRETGSLITVGLAIAPQTGPQSIAGAGFLPGINSTTIQPFMGYLLNRDRFFIQGFLSLQTPTNIDNAVMLYNDIGFYYFLYRANPRVDQLFTAIVPAFEVHVNNPLTHRNAFSPVDVHGTPDIVDLTWGLNVELNHRAVLTGAVATPVTGPRPFSVEAMAYLNIRFGARSRIPLFPTGG
jgi:hypothetical protein